MSFLIILIVFPAWLIQALKDGGNVKLYTFSVAGYDYYRFFRTFALVNVQMSNLLA